LLSKLTAILVALLVGGTLWAPAASAYEPAEGGTFNVPPPWGNKDANFRIIDHVERAMRETPRDPTPGVVEPDDPKILVTSFLMDRGGPIDAMIAACKRGVSVRVILDQDVLNGQADRLVAALNGDNPDQNNPTGPCGTPRASGEPAPALTDAEVVESLAEPEVEPVTWGADRSYVKRCDGACRGGGGNMHSKFYAFSSTGEADNVVMVSSSNLNRGGAIYGWNDLYTMVGQPRSFAEYDRIHRAMTDDTRANDQLEEFRDGPYTSRFFPMRNASKANDPVLQDLNKIGCTSAFGRTKVHVSMFYWAGTRGEYLATKLLNLARAGCQVSIIFGPITASIGGRLRDAAKNQLINLYDSRHNKDSGFLRTHSKYVLVKGRFGGNASSHQVMTGTGNWVAGSLSRGDENSLNISDKPSAYNDYVRNWEQVRQHSRRLPDRR
jgi:hypothetical protein